MLKKVLLFLVVALAMPLHAQYFGGGIVGGVNVSQIDGDFLGGYNKLGFIVGGYVDYDITEKISAIMELKYNQKGKVRPADIEQGDENYFKTVLHYAQLPVMVNYNLGHNFSFQVGLGFGYLINYTFYDAYGVFPKDEMGYEFRKYELAPILGVRYAITEKWFFDARWSKSFIPVANVFNNQIKDPNNDPFFEPGDQTNRTLEFTFGYRIGQ